jgi:asparagine synthase (glutamine-hydrolysing)
MCGIVGFIRKKNIYKSDQLLLEKMTNLLKHRGPDSTNSLKINNLFLGHTRLSIIDEKNSNQPMISENGNVLVFNGEILNFKELKKKYFKNLKFNTKGDTEVLLKGLEHKGINFLKEVRGFFAFAFYIKNKDEIIVGRDFFGVKPMYYHKDTNNFIFCSEINPILKFKKFKPNLNKKIIFEYLCRSAPPYLETFYKDIYEIEPGTVLKIKLKNLALKKIKYYDVETAWKISKNIKNKKNPIKKINQIFNKNLKQYLIADVKKGVMLSQGIDSSLIYYKILNNYDKKINSLTYKNDFDYSEDKNVKNFLKNINTTKKLSKNNLFKKVSRENIIKKLKEGIVDFPINYQFAFSMNNLYKFSKKKNIKVLFTGQGSDEIFAGYDRYYSIMNFKEKNNKNIFYGLGYKNISLVEKITNLKSQKFEKNNFSLNWLRKSKLNYMKKMLIFDQKFRLPTLLKLDDYMSMQNSIEVRPPFLDVDLVNYLNSLEEKKKFSKIKRKFLLQGLFNQKYKNKFGFDKKYGSISSVSSWTNSQDFLNILKKLVNNKKSLTRRYLNHKDLIILIKKNKNLQFIYWCLFNLEVWYQKNFKNLNYLKKKRYK